MPQGLDNNHLVLRWHWEPIPPLPVEQRLPVTSFRDDAAFRAGHLPQSEMTTFQFSFPQLSRQTPDLHFYRLTRTFNTPLLSLTTRDAGHAEFAYWGGARPTFREGHHWAHLWFFRDRTDGDLVVLEFGFEGGLTIYSEKKPADDLRDRYKIICAAINAAH